MLSNVKGISVLILTRQMVWAAAAIVFSYIFISTRSCNLALDEDVSIISVDFYFLFFLFFIHIRSYEEKHFFNLTENKVRSGWTEQHGATDLHRYLHQSLIRESMIAQQRPARVPCV